MSLQMCNNPSFSIYSNALSNKDLSPRGRSARILNLTSDLHLVLVHGILSGSFDKRYRAGSGIFMDDR